MNCDMYYILEGYLPLWRGISRNGVVDVACGSWSRGTICVSRPLICRVGMRVEFESIVHNAHHTGVSANVVPLHDFIPPHITYACNLPVTAQQHSLKSWGEAVRRVPYLTELTGNCCRDQANHQWASAQPRSCDPTNTEMFRHAQ